MMDRSTFFIVLILLLIGGLYFVGWQKKKSQEVQALTADFERYKKERIKEMEARVASPEQKMAEYVAQGWRQLDAGRYRAALTTARAILAIDSENEDAKSILSVAESALNRGNVSSSP